MWSIKKGPPLWWAFLFVTALQQSNLFFPVPVGLTALHVWGHGVVISSNSTVKIKVWSGPMLGGPFGP